MQARVRPAGLPEICISIKSASFIVQSLRIPIVAKTWQDNEKRLSYAESNHHSFWFKMARDDLGEYGFYKRCSNGTAFKDIIPIWLIWIGSWYPYQNVRDDMGSGLLKLVSNFTKFKLILSAEFKKERNSFQADHK